MKSTLAVLLACFVASAFGGSGCSVSKETTYTTLDGSVLTSIAYTHEFDLTCKDGKAEEMQLYGDLNGQMVTVAHLKANRFLVSWTTEVQSSTRGSHQINIFEDLNALKKFQSTGSGTPALQLSVHHPGSYTGPWLNSEHLAAILSVLVGYVAITSRSQLLA